MSHGTRAEHVAFSKRRALQYLDRGDIEGAMTSFISDLGDHPETAGHPASAGSTTSGGSR